PFPGRIGLLSRKADGGQDFVEQLPGGSDERLALAVLPEAGAFADEHGLGLGVSHPEDQLDPRRAQRADAAIADLFPEKPELLAGRNAAGRPFRPRRGRLSTGVSAG